MNYKLLSSDSHVVEPPDLWNKGIEAKYRDKAPRVITDDEGFARWYVDEDLPIGSVGAAANAGQRFEDPDQITFEGRYEEVRKGAYDPDARLEDLQTDGVEGEVIYPTIGARLFTILESELLSASFRASNDWMAEFCKSHPSTYKGIALVNLDDVEGGVEELKRSAGMGLSSAMIATYPIEEKPYGHSMYEPFWVAAQDLEMPISLHVASNRPGPGQLKIFTTNADDGDSASFSVTYDYWVKRSLASMIFAGVFERYPRLKVISVEHELSWAPHFLKMMDFYYRDLGQVAPYRFNDDLLPSDFFHSNVYMSFQDDQIGVMLRSTIGVDNIMWGSDFPHIGSTWPRSHEIIEKIMEGVPPNESRRMVRDNVAALFGFD